jgi:hypothetical protein
MAQWRGVIEVESVDLALVRSAISQVVDQLRNLSFSDGIAIDPVSGQPIAGVRDLTGTHPAVGTTYAVEVVTMNLKGLDAASTSPRPVRAPDEPSADTLTIVILADDVHRAAVRVVGATTEGSPWMIEIEALQPMRSAQFNVRTTHEIETRWPAKGALAADLDITVGDVLRGNGAGPTLRASIAHRRVRGAATVSVTAASQPDTWEAQVVAHAHCRGLLRPIAAMAWWISRQRIGRSLSRSLDGLPRLARQINTECTANPTPQKLATALVVRMLSHARSS